jgi:hypothetical protein
MKSLPSWSSVGFIGLVLSLVQVILADFYFVRPRETRALMQNLPRLSDNPALAASNEQELQDNLVATKESYQSRKSPAAVRLLTGRPHRLCPCPAFPLRRYTGPDPAVPESVPDPGPVHRGHEPARDAGQRRGWRPAVGRQ